MLGKRGIAGIAFVATALLAGGTASAQDYTGIEECNASHEYDSCDLTDARVPIGDSIVLSAVHGVLSTACPAPVLVPVGPDGDEIALCEQTGAPPWGTTETIARLRLDGRETKVATDSSGSAGFASTGFTIRSGGDGIRLVTTCRWGPPYPPESYCAPGDLIAP